MFSAQQMDTLRAAMDRVIPPDDFPGAWEAGAGVYLMLQLEGDLKHLRQFYQQSLDDLHQEAQQVFGVGFAVLEAAQQDVLLARIEKGQAVCEWSVDPAEFFRLLVEHTAEGFYSDPGNGGNHNGAAWGMIGFEVRG